LAVFFKCDGEIFAGKDVDDFAGEVEFLRILFIIVMA
jgi:hypothetical protein